MQSHDPISAAADARRRPALALALMLVVVLGGSWWTSRRIESDVTSRATEAVRATGSSAQVRVSGRDVTLSPPATSTDDRNDGAVAAAHVDGVRLVIVDAGSVVAAPQVSPSVTTSVSTTDLPTASPTDATSPSAAASGSSSPSPAATPSPSVSPSATTTARATNAFIPVRVLFGQDVYRLDRRAMASLNPVAVYLKNHMSARIVVLGNSDSSGSARVNAKVSRLRAEAVKTYISTRGVAPERIIIKVQGDSKPVASNATIAGRALNRRVDVYLEDQR